uniref:Ovule protein n=1 Tax=Romanomermis culicivorax TaxID=13658 RepID=A0A915JLJ0_ROMCU
MTNKSKFTLKFPFEVEISSNRGIFLKLHLSATFPTSGTEEKNKRQNREKPNRNNGTEMKELERIEV